MKTVNDDDQPSTKGDVKAAVSAAVEELTEVINNLADLTSRKFEEHDRRFDAMDRKFSDKFDGVYSILDGMSKKIDDNHIEQMALTSQVDRHERWIRKMA